MREDGLRIDRLLLTTDTNFIPTDFGPTETARQPGTADIALTLDRVIDYDYDNLYRLTEASYSTGELYEYGYDPVGNRLQQVIDGDTTAYLYDAANRLESLNGQAVYSFDNNGNLLNSDTLTNTFDAANRLTASTRDGNTVQPIYNGVNDRVGQVTAGVTTTFALDIAGGLPEVIYTSEDNVYLHLPGVIMAESSTGDMRYLLSDGLGSVRQAVDETGAVVAYNEFDPYGNPVQNGSEPYGYTGEWWEDDVGLLHLRARWYLPETGTFLSVDPVESEPPYQYVRGNPVNLTDPSGKFPTPPQPSLPREDGMIFGFSSSGHFFTGAPVFSLFLTPQGVQYNNCWLPTTGFTGGVEIVYDFKHLERGIFTYSGNAFNPLTFLGGGVSTYAGRTRGFVNFDYDPGVGAYSNRFKSVAWYVGSPGLGLGGGVIGIDAEPLDDNNIVNPNGVFARYIGLSGGVSAASPVNFEIAVTNYTLQDRVSYLDAEWKTNPFHRKIAATLMANEMNFLAQRYPPAQLLLPQALVDLQHFVYDQYLPVILK